MLMGEHPGPGLNLLLESGLLEVMLPEVAALVGVQQPPEFHPEGDVWTHTCLMFSLVKSPSATLALGILLHDVGKPPTFSVRDRIRFDRHAEVGAEMAARVCQSLRLSNQQLHTVVELVRQHLRFMHVQQMREAKLKRFLRQDDFTEHLELHRVDCLASHGGSLGLPILPAETRRTEPGRDPAAPARDRPRPDRPGPAAGSRFWGAPGQD